jgi:hypothetical protein
VVSAALLVVGLLLSLSPGFVRAADGISFQVTGPYQTGNQPYSVSAADFDGDSHLDLAVANAASGNVSIYLGDGTGAFTGPTQISVGSWPISIVSADFNKDGHPDLATANLASHNVSVLLGDGSGGFTVRPEVAVGTGPYALVSADFNADGHPDLATANRDSDDVSLLRGDGAGNLTEILPRTPAGDQPWSLVSADFNADGRPDLAVGNYTTPGTVAVLLNTGGGFVLAGAPAVGQYPEGVTAADFNLDGRPDLATANAVSNDVSILLGDGSGGFEEACRPSVGESPAGVIAADFDLDGKCDLAVSNRPSGTVSILRGDGEGGFSPVLPVTIASGSAPWGLASVDFNEDGKPDLAVADFKNQSLWILLNTTPVPGVLCLDAASRTVSEGDTAGTVEFTVTRSVGWDGTVTVDWSALQGSAKAGSDYTVGDPAHRTLTFGPGETAKTFEVVILDDDRVEADETFTVSLSNPTGGARLGQPSSAAVTIRDNDEEEEEEPLPPRVGPVLREHLSLKLTLGRQVAYVDGYPRTLDAPPFLTGNGRVMVPVRFITEILGACVLWNPNTLTVTVQGDWTEITLRVGQGQAVVRIVPGPARTIALDAPPVIVGGRVYVPLRFLGESLGFRVNFVSATGAVLLDR